MQEKEKVKKMTRKRKKEEEGGQWRKNSKKKKKKTYFCCTAPVRIFVTILTAAPLFVSENFFKKKESTIFEKEIYIYVKMV